MFDNSNPNCGIKDITITSDTKGTPISAKMAKTIRINASDFFKIRNNINKKLTYKFFIQAESSGGAFAYKPMQLTVTDNKAPYFKGFAKKLRLKTVEIKVDAADKDDKKQVVFLPKAIDDEGDKIKYTFTNTKHKWIKKVTFNNGRYRVVIDKTKIKAKDAGVIRVGINLKDDKYSTTRLENNYIMNVKISYKAPKKIIEKVVEDAKDGNATAAGNATANVRGAIKDRAGNATKEDIATVKTAASNATAEDSTAADSTAANATAADSTDSTAADTTAEDSTAEDSTATDSTAATAATGDKKKEAAKEKKAKTVKSGGQLAGLAISLDGDDASKKEKAVKKEKPKPPPIESLPITTQATIVASPTAPPKATIEPLVNPESTAAPKAAVKKAMGNLAKGLKSRKKNRRNKKKNRKNKKNQKKNANKDSKADKEIDNEPIEEEPVVDLGPMKVETGTMDASGGLPINSNQPTEPLGITSSTDPKTGRRRMYIQNFYDHPTTGKRQLLGVSEIDVSRDVVDLTFITETD